MASRVLVQATTSIYLTWMNKMAIQKHIDKKLEEIYEEFKKDTGDKTGWSLNQKLKKEAVFNEELINYFFYRIMKISYEDKKIISFLLSEFLSYPYNEEKWILSGEAKSENEIEIFPKIIFKKGIKTKVLESLGLDETLKTFYYHLVSKEEEINDFRYLTKEQAEKYRYWDFAIKEVLEVFSKEMKEKFPNSSRIIEIKK